MSKKVGKDPIKKTVSTGSRVSTSGSKVSMITKPPPVIMTKRGPIPTANQIVLEKKVERGVEGEKVTEELIGYQYGKGEKMRINVQHLYVNLCCGRLFLRVVVCYSDPAAGLPAGVRHNRKLRCIPCT